MRQGQGLEGNDGRRILGCVPENEAPGMKLVRVAFLALGKREYTRYLMRQGAAPQCPEDTAMVLPVCNPRGL